MINRKLKLNKISEKKNQLKTLFKIIPLIVTGSIATVFVLLISSNIKKRNDMNINRVDEFDNMIGV